MELTNAVIKLKMDRLIVFNTRVKFHFHICSAKYAGYVSACNLDRNIGFIKPVGSTRTNMAHEIIILPEETPIPEVHASVVTTNMNFTDTTDDENDNICENSQPEVEITV